MFDRAKIERALVIVANKQTKTLRASVKPLHSAFHGPKMRVYATKLKKEKADKIKKEKEKKEKLKKEKQ